MRLPQNAVKATNRRIIDALAPVDGMLRAYDQLTPTRRLFVDNYLATENIYDAYIEAYHERDERLARSRATALANDPLVQAAIAERLEEQRNRLNITADQVIEEIRRVAFANLRDYHAKNPDGSVVVEDGLPKPDFSNLTEEQWAAISEIRQDIAKDGTRKFSYKLHSKLDALEKLMKRFGLYAAERHEFSGPNGSAIPIASMNINTSMSPEQAAEYYQRLLEEPSSE